MQKKRLPAAEDSPRCHATNLAKEGVCLKSMVKVFLLAVIGGYLFSLLPIPTPWLLGPIFSLIIAQFFYKGKLSWSPRLQDIGILLLGIAIGEQFNLSLFTNAGILVLYMFVLNSLLMSGAIVLAYVLSKWSKLSFKAMILGTVPGGLAQILLLAEEAKDVDLAAVTYFQIARLLIVVALMPFLVSGHIVSQPATTAPLSMKLMFVFFLCWGCAFIAKRLKMPMAYFLAPILLVIGLSFTSLEVTPLPPPAMNGAQLLIGAHIGLMLKPQMVKLPFRYVTAGILSAIGLILIACGTSLLMTYSLGYSFATSFLSAAPGGLDQMILLANAIQADVSVVTVFQLFRLFFIFLFVMPLIKLYYLWAQKRA